MIETIGLSKIYSSGEGIKDINIKINPGEIFGILGPNGSGKSTLIKTLSTYLKPTSGSFKILGYEAKSEKDIAEIKKNIGVVFEAASHFEELSGLDNAYFFGKIYGTDSRKIDSFFGDFFLEKAKKEPVKNYSYGMKRKLSLIEALCHNPKVLLLDEPFTGLDYSSRLILQEKLKKIAQEDRTILIVSNEIFEIEMICHRVCFFLEGEVAEIDTVKNLLLSTKGTEEISLSFKKPVELDYLKQIEGVEKVFFQDDLIKILAKKGSLPQIVLKIGEVGGKILNLKIKEPNLGDVFIKKTSIKLK